MSDELKELADDLRSTWEEFKKQHSQETEEIKKLGDSTAEQKTVLDRLQAKMDEQEKAIEAAAKRADDLDVRFQKADLDTKDGKSAEAKAFEDWCRKGDSAPAESKASLQIGDDTAGGFLAPAEYVREIVKGVVEFSPVREVARVTETSATSVKVPKRTGTFAATWTASGGSRSETTGLTYGLDEIPTHELYALVDIENQLLEDSAFDMEAELTSEFSEQFGVAEGTAFVSGTGVGRPEGLLSSSQLVEVQTASNDAFVANDLIDLFYALKTAYARNGTWALNRGIMKAVRKFQDSVGNYLWQPGLAGLAPATILDRPYFECPDLASAVADNAKIAAFGDWRRGYRIIDRVVVSVQRDPFTQATAGATRFIARKRVGGQLVLPEAIKVLDVQ